MKKRIFAMAFLLVISMVTHFVWVFNTAELTHGDWYRHNSLALKEYFSLLTLWIPNGLGGVNISASFYPFNFISGLLANVNVTYGMIERYVFMWPIIVMSWLGIYLLIKSIFRSEIGAIVGSIVFAYNTYFLILRTGHLTLLLAFLFAPLVILLFQKALEKKEIKYSIAAGILGFTVSFFEFRVFYILAWVLFIYYLYFQFVITKKLSIHSLFKNGLLALTPIMLVGLLNIYWMLGFAQLGTLQSNEIFSRALFGNELIDIRNSLTLFHPFWTGSKPTEFIPQKIGLQYWLIPLGAILGLILQRKNKQVVFFGVITLLGILLTKQVGEPFSNLYLWLYNNLPGFNAFREASKFFFLIALGYAVLIAGLIEWIWEKWSKQKKLVYGKFLIVAIFMGIFLWNIRPFISGEIGTLFVPRYIPNDYKKVEKHIASEEDFYRTLWVPTYSRWSPYSNNHPQISAVNQLNSSWNKIVKEEFEQGKSSEGQLINAMMQKPEMNRVLDVSAIKYVLVPLKDTDNDDDFFKYYGVVRREYISTLDTLAYLNRVDIGTEDVIVYENEDYKPHIYVSSEREVVKQNVPHEQVKQKYINPTQYNVEIENIQQANYLHFSESYHPDWKIRVGDFNWLDSLTQSRYFIDSTIHSMNDAGLNSYYLDPKEICAQYECVENKDGSYNLNMTLYFYPQSYVYIGGVISISILFLSLGFLLYKFNEKNK